MDNKPQSPAEPQDGQFGQLGDRARDAGAGVKVMAKDAASRGTALAGEVAGDVKDRMLSAAEESKDGVGERLAGMRQRRSTAPASSWKVIRIGWRSWSRAAPTSGELGLDRTLQ